MHTSVIARVRLRMATTKRCRSILIRHRCFRWQLQVRAEVARRAEQELAVQQDAAVRPTRTLCRECRWLHRRLKITSASGRSRLTEEQRLQLGAFFTPVAQRPRVMLRFVNDEKKLLISGMLAGGSELANAPAVIDVPVGSGHVLLFAKNPMWRHQTQGSFFLLFNAALNFDSLNTERAPAPRPRSATEGDDQ